MEIKKLSETIRGLGNFILYGPSGSGKTYSLSTMPPGTLIVSAERKLRSLLDVSPDMDVAEIKSVEDVREVIGKLRNSVRFQFVAIDSLSEIANISLMECKEATRDVRKAYGDMEDTVTKLIIEFSDLPQTIIFIAQEERVNEEQVGILDYCYAPSIPGKKFMSKVPYRLDHVFALRTRMVDEIKERKFQTALHGDYLAKCSGSRLEMMEDVNWMKIFKKLSSKE